MYSGLEDYYSIEIRKRCKLIRNFDEWNRIWSLQMIPFQKYYLPSHPIVFETLEN